MAFFYRATVTIPADTGLPADSVINTYSFADSDEESRTTVGNDIEARLASFYTAFKDYFSSAFDLTAATVKIYDMQEDQPRFPFHDQSLGIPASATSLSDWPREVSVCLSMEGARVSGANMRRRRGRVYLGPFQMPSGDLDTVGSAFVSQVTTAADTDLLNPVSGNSDICVYSFYTHHNVPVGTKYDPDNPAHAEDPSKLLLSFTPVAKMWMDDAWDTQRRRGRQPTFRTTITA